MHSLPSSGGNHAYAPLGIARQAEVSGIESRRKGFTTLNVPQVSNLAQT
jgi:hypothetical protein